jgi:hypothetical protein
MSSALIELASQFNILKLRVYVRFNAECILPEFKGSLLHGWFGHALKHTDERVFHALFGVHDTQQPKPYLICPNEDLKTHWHKNELYYFDIFLFGEATQLGETIVRAIQYGQNLGFGKQRTSFSITCISSLLPQREQPGIHSTTLLDWFSKDIVMANQCEIALTFITPVRIKVANNILKNQGPDLVLFIKQIARRLTQLGRFWVCDEVELIKSIYSELPVFGDYEFTSHCYFEDWQRYSLKEKSALPFGGLKGQVSFYGEISNALPWLYIGEQLHIGGKTTFGLGNYQLIC